MGESIACGVEHEVHDWHRMCSVGEVQGHVRQMLRRRDVEQDVRAVQRAQDREQAVPQTGCCGTTLSAGRGRFAWHRAVCGVAEVQEPVRGVPQGVDGEGDVQDLPAEARLQQEVPTVECDRE